MPILGIWASQISGHLWAPAGAYDALATVTVPSGGAASIDFVGIPSGYKHLQIRGIQLATVGANAIGVQFNGVTSGYAMHTVNGDGSSPSADGLTSRTSMYAFGYRAGTSTAYPTVAVIDVLDYASTSKNKTMRALSGGGGGTGTGEINLNSGLWVSTNAINQITLVTTGGNFAQYSSFALYGIK